jgi:hypothetical protein
MNAQLLLTPSLFEMDRLARTRYNERPNEGVSIDRFIKMVRDGTKVVRYERKFVVEPPPDRALLQNMQHDMRCIENILTFKLFDIPTLERESCGTLNMCPERTSHMDEWFRLNRTGRGGKLSKVVMRKLTNVISSIKGDGNHEGSGLDKEYLREELRYSIRELTLKLSEWGKYPRPPATFNVVATREPMAFMRLGNNRCDNNSCYRQGSEYSPHSPLNLGATPDAYVFYIKDNNDAVIARAWGQIIVGGDCFFSNTYSHNMPGDSNGARDVFKVALAYWGKCEAIRTCKLNNIGGQYANDDSYGNHPIINANDAAYHFAYKRCQCAGCDEHADEEDLHHVDNYGAYCGCCVDNMFRWSNYDDRYIPEDEAVYMEGPCDYAHCDDVIQLGDGEFCLTEDAIEMYNGEWVHSNDAARIDVGDHAGSCTIEGDDCLMMTDDGETYIEGTYTPESEEQ